MIGVARVAIAGGAVILPMAAFTVIDRQWAQPAARMLWAELRGGDTRGDVEIALARALFERAMRAGTTPGPIIDGVARSAGDGPWVAGRGARYYEDHYRGAPVVSRYRAAAWKALIELALWGARGERHFTTGARPHEGWPGAHAVGAVMSLGAWVPVWIYTSPR